MDPIANAQREIAFQDAVKGQQQGYINNLKREIINLRKLNKEANRHLQTSRHTVSKQTKRINSLRRELKFKAGKPLPAAQPPQSPNPLLKLANRLKEALTLNASASGLPESFHPFPRLPLELQDLIWTLARPEGRYIALRLTRSATEGPYVSSPAHVPFMLHTCSRSRTIALKWYRLSFSGPQAISGYQGPRVYFDAQQDGVYIACGTMASTAGCCGHDEIFANMSWREGEHVRRVVWESPLLCNPMHIIAWAFPNVRQLSLVRGDGRNTVKEFGFREFGRVFEQLGDEERLTWQRDGKSLLEQWTEKLDEKDAETAAEFGIGAVDVNMAGRAVESLERVRFKGVPGPDLECAAWRRFTH